MSEKFIPEHVDPFRYAEQTLSLEGKVNAADMQRLSANSNLVKKEMVYASLHFGIDEQGTKYLKGHLETKLSLQCQRCLEPFDYQIKTDFLLGIVNSLDEANSLPEHYEPVLTKEGQLGLRELLEDEIILNLPLIPRHTPETCKVKLPLTDKEKSKEENPFHVLASLKRKDNSSEERGA